MLKHTVQPPKSVMVRKTLFNTIVLVAIVETVKHPTDKEAADPNIAKLLKENNAEFLKKCKEWATKNHE